MNKLCKLYAENKQKTILYTSSKFKDTIPKSLEIQC